MGNKLYVGNLSYDTNEDELRSMFSAYGTINSVAVITDRDTGRPKGFAFVEMGSEKEAQAAINGLNATEVGGRQIKVNEANDRPPRNTRDRY
ncbi:MAG TPA: RNA-binding protein [Spirochaetia bacterium]|nr:RNA-binding protein [Spirochaetia bacterium]